MDKSLIEKFKDLNDLEFEIIFIDSICKKMKTLNSQEVRIATMLFMYMSIVESLKKYKQLAADNNRTIPHGEAINMLINKGDLFLSSVAAEEDRSYYVYKSLSDFYEFSKDLLSLLKSEMTEDPTYAHLIKS